MSDEFLLMCLNFLPADLLYKIECCMEPHSLRDRWCSCFEFFRKMRRAKAIGEDFLNHRAAPKERLHGIKEFFFSVEHADTGGTVDFVAGECEEVAIDILHIDSCMRRKLRGIEERESAVLMCKSNELFVRRHRAKDVAHSSNCEELHFSLFQNPLRVFHCESSVFFDADPFHLNPDFLFKLEPWHDV